MTRKMLRLGIGVLAALALVAIPSAASAGEFVATCNFGACMGTVGSTGHTTLETAGGLEVTCTSVTGTTEVTHNSSTGSLRLQYHGCEESIFGTSCSNTGKSGTITSSWMTSHLAYLAKDKSKVGVMLTAAGMTFSCFFGSITRTITGNVIGEIENPSCGTARFNHTLTFEAGASTGSQKWELITTQGVTYDLVSSSEPDGENETTALVGTWHINYNEGKTVTFDC